MRTILLPVLLLLTAAHGLAVQVTFRVDMSDVVVSANGVHLTGAFQGWNPSATPMTDSGNGIYAVTLDLSPDTYAYKFVNGNDWGFDEGVPSSCGVDNGFGGFNRAYTLGDADVVLPAVCYSGCGNCSSSTATVMVLLQVDMTNVTVSPQGVHVTGDFQGWEPSSTEMSNMGGGLYEILYPVATNSIIHFKFINGTEWDGQESVSEECGVTDGFGGFNRFLVIGETNATYGPVCFSGCSACTPQTPVLVTFRVNMSNENASAQGVYVVGDFNEWDLEATLMSEYQPGFYQAIGVVNSGETFRYKFLNGPDFLGVENVPSSCGESDGFGAFNRSHTAASSNDVLPLVCFSSCDDCTGSGNVSVTFRVDLSEQQVSAQGVHVAGTFNNFSPTASPMTETSPGVYSFTANVPANSLLEFKYINGDDWPFAEEVPFACGVDNGFGGFNRSALVGATSLTLNTVCFGACEACPVNVSEWQSSLPLVYPNPATDVIYLLPNSAGHAPGLVYDAAGRIVARVPGNGSTRRTIAVSGWPAGFYTVHFEGTGAKVSFAVN